MSDLAKCELCGEPMPPGEQMFKFHGYSGPCPKPPLERTKARCVYCGLTFEPDINHPEHLCWEHLASANQAAETWKMQAETAAAEEREACAKVAREIAVAYLTGPQFEGYGRLAEVADKVNVAILARKST